MHNRGKNGSPPRMRGRPSIDRRRRVPARLTPANAGTTGDRRGGVGARWAHPRECGDDVEIANTLQNQIGSPPRMRGRPTTAPYGEGIPRLTPANAGTTLCDVAAMFCCSAHPRECGDDFFECCLDAGHCGSPPRMRGRRPGAVGAHRAPGLTPANAGTTHSRNSSLAELKAHPRECGDDAENAAQVREDERLTPANAGTTD